VVLPSMLIVGLSGFGKLLNFLEFTVWQSVVLSFSYQCHSLFLSLLVTAAVYNIEQALKTCCFKCKVLGIPNIPFTFTSQT